MIKDRNVIWRQKKLSIYAAELLNRSAETAGVPTGLGTGGVVMAQINSLSALSGIQIDAAGADATGDEIHWWMTVPYDMDIRHPLRLRVLWTSGSSTAADDVAFVAMYTPIVIHDTAIVAAATALNTVIPSDLVTGAWDLQATGWGIANGSLFAEGGAITWEIRCSVADVDLSGEKLFVLGVEFMYTPQRMHGPGNSKEAINPNF